ncbi:hypothetical protein JZ751_010668 [Albula glossodonta]|uniref:Uncharacterized protein n=1 Tax=Albula glossodonta TaxID=121402 RepID=A0A8T2N789_9TELE|nr:hypothetical protein JZ751_010668 [Albula glossodonta]
MFWLKIHRPPVMMVTRRQPRMCTVWPRTQAHHLTVVLRSQLRMCTVWPRTQGHQVTKVHRKQMSPYTAWPRTRGPQETLAQKQDLQPSSSQLRSPDYAELFYIFKLCVTCEDEKSWMVRTIACSSTWPRLAFLYNRADSSLLLDLPVHPQAV